MVSTTVKRESYSAETQQLLKEKSLQCICELCDCGRHHRHEGCTKSTDEIKKLFKRPGLKECSTDYQSSYKLQPCHFVRSIRRPLPRLRNPNPPPMDFRTVTNTEYVHHDDFPGRPKPFKLEDNFHPLSNDQFDGQTSYAAAFVNRGKPTQVKLTRPVTNATGRPQHRFSDETTHNTTFSAKTAARATTFSELPSFAGSLLYPDRRSSNLRTQNQESYQGTYAPRSDFCGPRETAIKLGIEGDYEHETVHRTTYKKHEDKVQRSPKVRKPMLKLAQRVTFDATTQAQSDFPSYKKGGFPPPQKPCPPYPATINLAVDSSQDFTTTNKELYKGQWGVGVVKMKPKESRYSPPKEKFHETTQTMEDFKPKQITRVSFAKPAQNIAASKLKLSDETSYKAQYPRYTNSAPFTRYGDFHEQAFYVKPLVRFDQQGGSVTTKDFKQPGGFRPRTSYKPKEKLDGNKGEMVGESEYRSTYKQKELQECMYVKYVEGHKARDCPTIPAQNIIST